MYHYLRLYVNGFAYEVIISRAVICHGDTQLNFLSLTSKCESDSRFIYDAVDAAKSILSTFNIFIAPETFRCMPSSYYFFIIYAAVFLHKAKFITIMTYEESAGIENIIDHTIERLKMAATGLNHIGSRYARLLQLLWRKTSRSADHHEDLKSQSLSRQANTYSPPPLLWLNFDQGNIRNPNHTSIWAFSWLDLDATWNLASQTIVLA